ncbi:MAG: hypothetical protein B7Z83_02475 [Thiomonas sp. 20-64-5]|nr:MAG: hypothetical protein B7Z83_02475 [Thiomonas sp. 20-64-5]
MFGDQAPASTRLDMAITRSEFARQLRAAFPALQESAPDVFSGEYLGCQWSIRLQPTAPTRLGLIVLERWLADIRLGARTLAQRQLWWQRFSAHFQKGGG